MKQVGLELDTHVRINSWALLDKIHGHGQGHGHGHVISGGLRTPPEPTHPHPRQPTHPPPHPTPPHLYAYHTPHVPLNNSWALLDKLRMHCTQLDKHVSMTSCTMLDALHIHSWAPLDKHAPMNSWA